jgi:hypothetical protein
MENKQVLVDFEMCQINGLEKVKGGKMMIAECDNTIVAKCGGCISVIPPEKK